MHPISADPAGEAEAPVIAALRPIAGRLLEILQRADMRADPPALRNFRTAVDFRVDRFRAGADVIRRVTDPSGDVVGSHSHVGFGVVVIPCGAIRGEILETTEASVERNVRRNSSGVADVPLKAYDSRLSVPYRPDRGAAGIEAAWIVVADRDCGNGPLVAD